MKQKQSSEAKSCFSGRFRRFWTTLIFGNFYLLIHYFFWIFYNWLLFKTFRNIYKSRHAGFGKYELFLILWSNFLTQSKKLLWKMVNIFVENRSRDWHFSPWTPPRLWNFLDSNYRYPLQIALDYRNALTKKVVIISKKDRCVVLLTA